MDYTVHIYGDTTRIISEKKSLTSFWNFEIAEGLELRIAKKDRSHKTFGANFLLADYVR